MWQVVLLGVCNTAKTCNMTFCRGKDIESDLTSSSGRWIVLGHMSQVHTDRPLATDKHQKEYIYHKYVDGSHQLSIVTDYKPIHCVLVPLQSSIALIDTCVEKTGIHYILMGDSVTIQHVGMLKHLLNFWNRITFIDVGCKWHVSFLILSIRHITLSVFWSTFLLHYIVYRG